MSDGISIGNVSVGLGTPNPFSTPSIGAASDLGASIGVGKSSSSGSLSTIPSGYGGSSSEFTGGLLSANTVSLSQGAIGGGSGASDVEQSKMFTLGNIAQSGSGTGVGMAQHTGSEILDRLW